MWDDPIVADVRAVREQLAAQFEFDVHAIFADLRARQVETGKRLVRRKRALGAEHVAALDRHSAPLRAGR